MSRFRFVSSDWLAGSLHLFILAVAAQAEDADVWPYALAAMAVVSFFAWIACYRRYRHVHDLPTSKVASAAQGYVELFGRAELLPGSTLVSLRTGVPCCWRRHYIERKESDNKWKFVESGESTDHFLLVDETGQCVISPEGAEVITDRSETWIQGDYRHTESLLLPKSPLYALGEFSTISGAVTSLEERADVGGLLAEWKQDRQRLLQRFDANRDGVIDMQEWERARLEAQIEVRQRHDAGRAAAIEGVHIMRKPSDGRIFVLADELPDRLGRRFAVRSLIHLVVFFGAGAASLLLFR